VGKFLDSLYQKNSTSVIINKFDGDFSFLKTNSSETDFLTGIIFDLETTGLSPVSDEIIEISYISFKYSTYSNVIVDFIAEHSFFQEPVNSIPISITKINGYTKGKLKGKKIDWGKVQDDFERASLIIAHNASFDRPFIERFLPKLKNKAIWACSLKHIDWPEEGHSSGNLELLCIYHGFYCDFHKASEDCKALMYLLTKKGYFKKLITNAHRPMKIYKIQNFPFSEKDLMNKKRFRWNPKEKIWFKQGNEFDPEDEADLKNICSRYGAFLEIINIPPTENFSSKWNF
jgi:DNA polymerase-3 subunit epsilon